MQADLFYELCDFMENLAESDITNNYYPKVSELQAHHIENCLPAYLPLISYFAGDPFQKTDSEFKDEKDYQDLVKYANELLLKIDLEDEDDIEDEDFDS